MKNSIFVTAFKAALYRIIPGFIIYLCINTVNGFVFSLYSLRAESFVYGLILSSVIILIYGMVLLINEYRKAKKRKTMLLSPSITEMLSDYPLNPETHDFAEMIEKIEADTELLCNEYRAGKIESEDFYTVWVHQIKTPIAVMKLALAENVDIDRKVLQNELFSIEQYTDMVLTFMRLESESNDLLIKEYELDSIIRETIRKYAQQFILKKIRLSYEGTEETIITDRKWFVVILEQIVSNALKYTSEGTISISVHDRRLDVSDTGMGIAKEDLPRIFEKGFTGINGRAGEKSSGLGLYLCTKACEKLNLRVSAESQIGKGSTFSIHLGNKHCG